ncbi:NADP-dependent oxidoreductase domain-containing protein [Mycena leptocephala]|nr:NADP-dependent oxidoreductase domain-containing protein [Mycena leptocephala]
MANDTHPQYAEQGMPFRRLGPSGLRVPLFSVGGCMANYWWLWVGDPDIIKTAFENGINMFDTAEDYSKGKSEIEMGRVIKELNLRRTDLVISTKIFWGPRDGPNDKGLSRKHIIEGTQECLERLQMTYVDVIFAHRHDRTVPMEEIVRAFNYVIEKGWAFYWATSEWTAQQIEEAHHVATKLNLVAPIAEQCMHHMFHRERPEKEYACVFSTSLGSTPTALALAWVAKNPNTSTVILGVSSAAQLVDNLKALEVLPKMTDEIMEKIEEILGNKPAIEGNNGRPELDTFGRV